MDEWEKRDFKTFSADHGIELTVKSAPSILYPKKDKEHEAFNSLVGFFLISGSLLIFIALYLILAAEYYSLTILIIVIVGAVVVDLVLLLNFLKSNVYIKPMECWMEIFEGNSEKDMANYCFVFYPIFSGKCHPNKALNVIYKVYQEEFLKSTIDIAQIELYLKISRTDKKKIEPIGYFFQYGEGKSFIDEDIDRNNWKFFPYSVTTNDNFIAVANWDHQFELKNDLALDYDKLHEYAPWVIQRWNTMTLKPLTDEYKEKVIWDKRNIDSEPKLVPWKEDITSKTYTNPAANKDLDVVKDATIKVIGEEYRVKKLKDIKEDLMKIKAYFRDLNS